MRLDSPALARIAGPPPHRVAHFSQPNMPILPQAAVVTWAALGCLASSLHGASIELTYIREILCAPTNAPVDYVVSSNGLPGQFLVPTVRSRLFHSVPPYF